jgi:hypothetical protein
MTRYFRRITWAAMLLTSLYLPATFGASPITNDLFISLDANTSSISTTTWGPSDGTAYSGTLSSTSLYSSPNTYLTFPDNTASVANYVDLGVNTGVSDSYTVETWVRINTMKSVGWNIIATKWFQSSNANTDATNRDFHFGFNNGLINVYWHNGTSNKSLFDTVARTAGWYQAAFTINQPTPCNSASTVITTLYLNGTQVATSSLTDACHRTSTEAPLVLGERRKQASLNIDGDLYRFRIFKRALSSTEINRLFRAEALSTFAGNVSAAPYASTLPSFSGNSRVGQLQTGNSGTWINGVIGYTYRWYRSNSNNGTYSPISGATSSNYTATSSDFNQYLKFEVTATNAQGSITETSTATQILQGSPSLTLTSGLPTATYRTIRNLGLNPGAEGKVTFTHNGKRIAGCINLPSNSANSYSVTCPWKPSKIGFNEVKAQFTSSDLGYASGTSPITTLFVQKRSGNR